MPRADASLLNRSESVHQRGYLIQNMVFSSGAARISVRGDTQGVGLVGDPGAVPPPRMPENFRKIFYNIFSIGGTFLVPPPLAAPMIKRVIQFKKRIKMRELLIKCCIENKQKPSQSNDDRRKWSWMSVIIFKKIGLGNMGKFARIEFNGQNIKVTLSFNASILPGRLYNC